jgi:ABC-2 type transport system permease protein
MDVASLRATGRSGVGVVAASARIARADLAVTYTWRTWTFGWLVRMVAQALYFTLLGETLGGGHAAAFLVLGNGLMVCVVECMMVVASTARERESGTLILLAAAPAPPLLTFFGRGLYWPLSGTATSVVALLALGPVFSVHWTIAQVPLLVLTVAVTAMCTYCVGLVLAALVLHRVVLRNLVSNVAYLVMMAICGAEVATTYWPKPIGWAAHAFPLTYTLQALRALAEPSSGGVALPLARAVVVAAAWTVAAAVAFGLVVRRGRRTAQLDVGW